MLSVELKLNPTAARRFVDSLTLFGIGFSWGGFESLVQLVDHAALQSHGYWQPNNNAVIRLPIGLESPTDLTAALPQALDNATSSPAPTPFFQAPPRSHYARPGP